LSRLGFRIVHVTFDSFQSDMAISTLRKAGFNAFRISVDKTMEPYECMRNAMYQGRLAIVSDELLKKEFTQLETRRLATVTKVEHPKRGSKDISDGVTGAVYGASMSPTTPGSAFLTDPGGERLRISPARPQGGNRPHSMTPPPSSAAMPVRATVRPEGTPYMEPVLFRDDGAPIDGLAGRAPDHVRRLIGG